MPSLTELLAGQLSGSALSQLGQSVGADDSATTKAVTAALPLLLGALARNASEPEGASALHAALQRDHDGSILDDLTGALSGAKQDDGAKILGHAFGGRQGTVEAGVAKASGLDAGQVGQLMATVAPLVMGALGKVQREQNLDVSSLAGALGQERSTLEKGGAGAMISGLLDQDGDGSVMDDLGSIGSSLLGKFLDRN